MRVVIFYITCISSIISIICIQRKITLLTRSQPTAGSMHTTSLPQSSSRYGRYALHYVSTYTVFIQIVAAATINFSFALVQLLIEGGCYLRVAFINFGSILDGVIHKNRSTEG